MRAHHRTVTFCVTALIVYSASALSASDTIIIHGHIYTGNPKAPWAQALAVSGTRINAVGTDQEILSRKHPQTEGIDLHLPPAEYKKLVLELDKRG